MLIHYKTSSIRLHYLPRLVLNFGFVDYVMDVSWFDGCWMAFTDASVYHSWLMTWKRKRKRSLRNQRSPKYFLLRRRDLSWRRKIAMTVTRWAQPHMEVWEACIVSSQKFFFSNPFTFRSTGHQEGHAQAVQEEAQENEQTHSGRAETGKTDFFVLTV